MNSQNNIQPNGQPPVDDPVKLSRTGVEKVIQPLHPIAPSESNQSPPSQPQAAAVPQQVQTPQPPTAILPVQSIPTAQPSTPHQPSAPQPPVAPQQPVGSPQQVQPPVAAQSPVSSVYPNPGPAANPAQVPIGVSASDRGVNDSSGRTFSPKKILAMIVLPLLFLGSVFAALVLTKTIVFSEFTNVTYTDSEGVDYSLDFYSKHSIKQDEQGRDTLVSEVSKGGKFPLALQMSASSAPGSSQTIFDCTGSDKKLEVQNDNLEQQITVCGLSSDPSDGVYLFQFTSEGRSHIATIVSDFDEADLSSASAAQESLEKFGLAPYHDDIERILASIKVE